MVQGRKKIPAHLSLVTAKSPKKKKELKARIANEPASDKVEAPEWLDAAALVVWDEHAPEAMRLGVLTNYDVRLFADFCQCLARVGECEKAIARDGASVPGKDDHIVRHPLISVANQYRDKIAKYAERFGVGAAARAALPPPKTDTKDPWEK